MNGCSARVSTVFVLAMVMSASAARITQMVEEETHPQITSVADKAVLVIYVSPDPMQPTVYNHYIDEKLIGQTKKWSYFVTEVEPGTRWLTHGVGKKPYKTAKITFEAGKVYYIFWRIMPMAGLLLFPQDSRDFIEWRDKNKADYLVFRPNPDDMDPLDPKKVAKLKAEYEEQLVEDPERHKSENEYRGE